MAKKKRGRADFLREGARIFATPSWVLVQLWGNEDDLDDVTEYDDLCDDFEEGLSLEDLGLCPHCGAADDEGCDSDCPSRYE